VQGVLSGRSDLGIFVGRIEPALRQRWVIICVDEIVQRAGMVRLRSKDLFEDSTGLELFGVGLVAGQRRLVKRQRVEDCRLRIVRIFLHDLFHRLFVGETACRLVDLVVVFVVKLDRREPVALALGLGADRLTLFHRFPSVLQDRSGKRQDQRVGTVADRDAPVGDCALRIGGSGVGEGLDAVRIDERVHHREAAVEFLLRLRRARRLEVHAAEILRPGRSG
jgi:hypothetical protein